MTDEGGINEAAIDRASDESASPSSMAHHTHAIFPDWGSSSDFDDSGLEELVTEYATSHPNHSTSSISDPDDDWRSLTSSIAQHSFENGRRYHQYRDSQPYPWPNDELDTAREEELHELFKELMGGRHFIAPIDEGPQRILDLGCGNGRWASEVAELFPGAEVVAMDISPIQPVFAPPNLTLRLADIETDWVGHMQSDLVHLERVAPYLRQPKELLAKILTNLRPGGWVELEDIQTEVFSDDAVIPPENGCAYAATLFNKSQREKFGFDLDTAWNMAEALRDAGFVNVRQVMYKTPIGPWPDHPRGKWVGYLLQSALRQVMEPLSLRPLQALGLSQSDISAVVHDFERDMSDTSLHLWMPMTITIGQKSPTST